MALESIKCNVLVILGTHCKNHSAFGEFQCVALQAEKGFPQSTPLAQYNPFQSVVANDATPERIVEVKHQAF
ncbi:hypothetical protein A5658_11030 [Mycobacterium sp. 1245111.1]|nr:hypothetical protein A5658_11030 [Mycobacterium sp. 1245111.1]